MFAKALLLLLLVPPLSSAAWVQGTRQDQSKPADKVPDAPSATRPVQPFPPPTAPGTPVSPTAEPPAATDQPDQAPTPPETPGPTPAIKTVPAGGESEITKNTRDEIYTLKRRVDFVAVPVTVKDKTTGRMVDGLSYKDFEVLENGVKQKLTYFTSDPFFISAAVIFDVGMSDDSVKKVQQTFPALMGAFSAYDQVAIYTFSETVSRVTGFSAVNERLTEAVNQLKSVSGRNTGVPVTTGPMASGPVVNGMPVGGTPQPVSTPAKESHVLNDAILRAALDLSKQDRTRRKVIFVISTGREFGSTASYADTLKVLLSNEIAVYGVATGASALPVYSKLSKLHLPRQGYDNLLPKYAAATGGEVFTEFSKSAIDQAYAKAMGDARNQYTLGYQTRAPQTDTYRDIEVRVGIPNLVVHAKAGYYPLPPQRSAQP
jgi:VWFA-related protein